MLGWICWTARREKPGRAELAGLPVLRAAVLRRDGTPEWLLGRRVRAAGRALARASVRRVILPEGFPYGELLAGEGVFPADTLTLWQTLAAELALAELARQGIPWETARVQVTARSLTPPVRQAVEKLLRRCRYVALDVPDPAGAFARQLRRSLGAALLPPGPGADVALCFAPGTGAAGEIALYRDAVQARPALRLPPEWEAQLPPGADRAQVVAALLAAGRLRAGEIGFDNA